MNLNDTLSVRLAIDELNAEFAYALDHVRYDRLDALFTDDVLYVSGARELHGAREVRSYFEQRATLGPRSSRHMWSGLRIVDTAPDCVRATSVWLSFAANAPVPLPNVPIFMVADFHDTYRWGKDGRWRIAERRIVEVFRNPDAAPLAG